MNKNILYIVIGILLVAGLGFGAYKFLTLKDFEFNKSELSKAEQTISTAVQAYHQHGWDGAKPFILEQFVAEYSAGELDKILKFLIGPGKDTDQYAFVLEEFSPPPADEKPIRVEISGVITQNSFPVSLGKFQLVREKSDWLISGFFGENSKGIDPLTVEELAKAKTVLYDFFDLASRDINGAYDTTHEKFRAETNLNDFKRILSVLELPLPTEPKCRYHFKTENEALKEEIDQVIVLKNCKTSGDYALELTLLKKGDTVSVGGLFVK